MEKTKRKFSRIPLNFPATLIVANTEVYDIHELANLSIGGCLVPLDEDILEGTRCTITIRLVGGLGNTPVNITGEVVRHDKKYVAIKFTKISPDNLNHLQNLIRYNAPDPDIIDQEILKHPGLV
ncbi:MAG: PilZ domain-containing protein [Desulfopila sp.]|jgi:hypothetical protein|nr:PilZ domain-containing protein [Desulfopila sp.]